MLHAQQQEQQQQEQQQEQQQQEQQQEQREDVVCGVTNGESCVKGLMSASLLEVLKADDGGRSVETDYPVPSWLRRQGVTAPCEYAKTFRGKYGIINYELTGPQHTRTVYQP
ncbi:hypothetical protein ACSSS7_007254 [Eimeria intestinalis]